MLMLTTILKLNIFYAENDPSGSRVLIRGTVTGQSQTPLFGAHVFIPATSLGCITDSAGFFHLTLTPGDYRIRISHIGYSEFDTNVTITQPGNFSFQLHLSENALHEVIITAPGVPDFPEESVLFRQKDLSKLPALLGENDPLKVIQLLPGIHSVIDGGTGMSVRGGDIDENLVLLDQATLYNPSHMLGFFSVFNDDMVKEIRVFKGNQPIRYGGRLSSVTEVTLSDGSGKGWHGSGETGLLASNLMLACRTGSDKFSGAVSARRSYADLFMPLLNNPDFSQNRIYFYDLYGKARYNFNGFTSLSISAYKGNDAFKNPHGYSQYGNQMASAQLLTDKGRFHHSTAIVYSDYRYGMGTTVPGKPGAFSWSSIIREFGIKEKLNVAINQENSISAGFQLLNHYFDPCYFTGTGGNSFFGEYKYSGGKALEGAIFAEHTYFPYSTLKIVYGFRFSGLINLEKSGTKSGINHSSENLPEEVQDSGQKPLLGLEPRIRISKRLGRHWWLMTSYSRNQQYIHLAHTAIASNPVDVWFPSDDEIPSERADLFMLGLQGNLFKKELSVDFDLYFKSTGRALEFQDHTTLYPAGDLSENIITGTGKSAGLECRITKSSGWIYGWISYTYSRTWRQFYAINLGQSFPSSYDIPHDLSVVLNLEPGKRLVISAVWVYATGKPYTSPAGVAYLSETIVPLYNSRNNARLADYHRLDLSLKILGKPGKKFQSDWTFSVYNAYNRKNVMNLQFLPSGQSILGMEINRNYLFPIMPSVSYHFKF